MLCPRCQEPLKAQAIADIAIDECLRCNGTWFDRDELRQAKDAVEPDVRWQDFEIWTDEDSLRASLGSLLCPQCQVPMVSIGYADTKVEIDYCPQCEGTWLDRAELDRIINALEKEAATKTVSEYVQASLQEAREVISGSEGVISEWRDLTTVVRLFQYRVLIENPQLQAIIAALQAGT